MEICRDIASVQRDPCSILTVGTFDGLHLGHQSIIEELKKKGDSKGCRTTLVTFQPHPKNVLRAPDEPDLKVLTSIDEKIGILETLAINRLVIIEFTYEFSRITPDDFVNKILFDVIGFNEIIIGYDHGFGKDRQGSIATLRKFGAERGFLVGQLIPLEINKTLVSSSKIRSLLFEGRVDRARQLLGRNYHFSGKVVAGEGRGKDMKFPTANIQPNSQSKLIPGNGVYAAYVRYGEQKYSGMMNIGVRPTFPTSDRAIEVHIFGFDKNVYGETLHIEFVKRIRDERRFSGSAELVSQLKLDQESCLSIL
ncbi:MAG: bifunctional riboflavin kinase/FAD synthetase [bacterium]